jgi:hypothetical protein
MEAPQMMCNTEQQTTICCWCGLSTICSKDFVCALVAVMFVEHSVLHSVPSNDLVWAPVCTHRKLPCDHVRKVYKTFRASPQHTKPACDAGDGRRFDARERPCCTAREPAGRASFSGNNHTNTAKSLQELELAQRVLQLSYRWSDRSSIHSRGRCTPGTARNHP